MLAHRAKTGTEATHYLGLDGLGEVQAPASESLIVDLAEYLTASGVKVCKIRKHQLAHALRIRCPQGNVCYSLGIHWQPLEMSTINDVETALQAAPELQLESLCLHFLQTRQTIPSGAFCLASRSQLLQLADELRIYASRVKQEYVEPREAIQLCDRANILLEELSGDDTGIVGALAAIVLYHSGQGKSLTQRRPEAELR